MKHFSLLLLLLCLALRPAPSYAQATDSLSQKLLSIFAHLDKSQVPTSRLYEAGVRFFDAHYYAGTLSDSNRTNADLLRYLYAQFRSCRVVGTDTLPDLPTFNTRLQAAVAAGGGAIPLAVQYMPYARIRPDALQQNLLSAQNEQLYDVPGRSQSPYQAQTLFLAAPERSYSRTGTVSFLFRRNLYLAGDGTLPTSLYLDFGDGAGYQLARWGRALSTTYAAAGTKRIKVKLVYGGARNGEVMATTRESWFDFQVLNPGAVARYGDASSSGRQEYYLKPPGNPYGATVTVMYGKGHGRNVVKPLILVEQYNIAGAAPHLVECNNANNTVDLLLPKLNTAGSFNFNESLETAGYDLIYIDFEENLDDIARNAQVVEYIIQQVNAWKATAHTQGGYAVDQNVVLGMSMGGLIGRYALAAMTRNPAPFGPPDTRLLVLHDSPQRGAYNPLGIQCFSRATAVPLNIFLLSPSIAGLRPSLASFNGKLKDAVYVLDQPASQQLGILSALDSRGTNIQPNTFIDGVYKTMVDFTAANPANTASTPQPTYQLVATSDGSQCGRGSGAPLGVQLSGADTSTLNWLQTIQDQLPGFMPFITLGVRGAAYGLPAYGQQALISRMRVYIEYNIKIGACPFCLNIPIRYDVLNENAISPPNTLPYETLPGGFTNLATESGDCGSQTGITSVFLQTGLYNGPICFVPTYSAFDVPNVTPATAASSYLYGVPPLANAVPRVQRYIAQANKDNIAGNYNLNHLTYTARNSEWIFNEMQGQSNASLNCITECSPYPAVPISGPEVVCATGSATFTVAPPFGNVTSWSVAPAGLATFTTPTAGATSVTLVPASSNSQGLVTLTAQLSSGCFSSTATRQVAIGQDILTIGDNQTTAECAVYEATFALGQVYGAPGPYTWQVSAGTITDGQGSPQISVENLPYQDYQLTVTVSSPSACAGQPPVTATYQRDYYTTSPNGSTCPRLNGRPTDLAGAALYPNPAQGTVNVHLTQPGTSATTFTVRLFDSYGQLRAEQSGEQQTLQLKTDQLPAGLYFVHILRGKEVLSRQQLRLER